VITFLVALVHGAISIGYYHGFSDLNPFMSFLTSSSNVLSLRSFPFEWLGLTGLAVLLLMAATSHDFWLRNMGAASWKRLHMAVYVAYAVLVAHVALGALQSGRGWWLAAALGAGVLTVSVLHLMAATRERKIDRGTLPILDSAGTEGAHERAEGLVWIDAGRAEDIPEDRARTVCAPGGERIAVFRHAGGLSAVTNVCAHQGGPLSEGRVIDGCITCPWHGWQYRPEDGRSPPPFTELIPTYQVRVVAGRVQVRADALPPGTPVAPAPLFESTGGGRHE
jgi:nitrite reductase/ring-hydroxylating ferredoxin subunit